MIYPLSEVVLPDVLEVIKAESLNHPDQMLFAAIMSMQSAQVIICQTQEQVDRILADRPEFGVFAIFKNGEQVDSSDRLIPSMEEATAAARSQIRHNAESIMAGFERIRNRHTLH